MLQVPNVVCERAVVCRDWDVAEKCRCKLSRRALEDTLQLWSSFKLHDARKKSDMMFLTMLCVVLCVGVSFELPGNTRVKCLLCHEQRAHLCFQIHPDAVLFVGLNNEMGVVQILQCLHQSPITSRLSVTKRGLRR